MVWNHNLYIGGGLLLTMELYRKIMNEVGRLLRWQERLIRQKNHFDISMSHTNLALGILVMTQIPLLLYSSN